MHTGVGHTDESAQHFCLTGFEHGVFGSRVRRSINWAVTPVGSSWVNKDCQCWHSCPPTNWRHIWEHRLVGSQWCVTEQKCSTRSFLSWPMYIRIYSKNFLPQLSYSLRPPSWWNRPIPKPSWFSFHLKGTDCLKVCFVQWVRRDPNLFIFNSNLSFCTKLRCWYHDAALALYQICKSVDGDFDFVWIQHSLLAHNSFIR